MVVPQPPPPWTHAAQKDWRWTKRGIYSLETSTGSVVWTPIPVSLAPLPAMATGFLAVTGAQPLRHLYIFQPAWRLTPREICLSLIAGTAACAGSMRGQGS